jgi:anti-sigma regulatory factor (Ser/Thr protein kinase)
MNNIRFVPSTLHVVASGVNVEQDLQAKQEHSISELLDNAYETEKETNQ